MGIQTTVRITREEAIKRLISISVSIRAKRYVAIDEGTREDEVDLESFVDDFEQAKCLKIENHGKKFSDKMLEDYMNQPFFRFSPCENYMVGD